MTKKQALAKKLELVPGATKKKIGFNNSAAPLGQRKPEDLFDLALEGLKSGNPRIIGLFKELPTLDEMLAASVETAIDATPTLPAGAETLPPAKKEETKK